MFPNRNSDWRPHVAENEGFLEDDHGFLQQKIEQGAAAVDHSHSFVLQRKALVRLIAFSSYSSSRSWFCLGQFRVVTFRSSVFHPPAATQALPRCCGCALMMTVRRAGSLPSF